MNRQQVSNRLEKGMKKNGYFIGAAAGSGSTARLLKSYDADFVLALYSERIRQMGADTAAGFLPIGNSNRLVLSYAEQELLPKLSDIPVIFGLCATDPTIDCFSFLDLLAAKGFSGIINYPSVGIFEGLFGEALEENGNSYECEVEAIRQAKRKGFYTIGCVFNISQAQKMADAGADMICAYCNLGCKSELQLRNNIKNASDILKPVAGHKNIYRTVFAGNSSRISDIRYLYEHPGIRELIEGGCMEQFVDLDSSYPEKSKLIEHEERKILQGKEDYVNFVTSYVEQNYQSKLSFNEIADKINISRSYLSVLFNQTTGRTFLEYVTDYRMKKALELMRQSHISLYRLAEQVGYEDYAHFSKVFKKRMGVCPKQFVS